MPNITRWDPLDEFPVPWPRSLFGRDFLTRLRPGGEFVLEWSPRCDISESDEEVLVHAGLPGVDAKDIEVSVSGGALAIRGEKRSETSEENGGRSYQERFFGSFERTIALPPGVDADKIEARLKDGVLEVRVPRPARPATDKKAIEVKTG